MDDPRRAKRKMRPILNPVHVAYDLGFKAGTDGKTYRNNYPAGARHEEYKRGYEDGANWTPYDDEPEVLREEWLPNGQLKKLFREDGEKYRVQIWSADGNDWDWIEGTQEDMQRAYELTTNMDELLPRIPSAGGDPN